MKSYTDRPNLLVYRQRALAKALGVHPITVRRWAADPNNDFPRPITTGCKKVWLAREIDAWLAKRAAARDGAA